MLLLYLNLHSNICIYFFFKHNKIKFQKHKYVSHINYKKETKNTLIISTIFILYFLLFNNNKGILRKWRLHFIYDIKNINLIK